MVISIGYNLTTKITDSESVLLKTHFSNCFPDRFINSGPSICIAPLISYPSVIYSFSLRVWMLNGNSLFFHFAFLIVDHIYANSIGSYDQVL